MDHVLKEGSWFWRSADQFMTPWFLGLDVNIMVVSKMSIWVRLHNLPLHFWHHKVIEEIENTMGKYIKTNLDITIEEIFIFARICVWVDKALPDRIHMIHNNLRWTQFLYFENTTFRCRICVQTWHLQHMCPRAKKDPKRKKKQTKKPKGWKFPE